MKRDVTETRIATRAIHAGQEPEARTGAVSVPIFQTATYVQPAFGTEPEFDYARVQNPTRQALEANVAALESGHRGHAFASGMAAITALLSTVESDEHVVVSNNVYGGTHRLITQVLSRYRLESSWVDTSDQDAVAAALRDNTRLLFIESPTNPMMGIADIAALSEMAHGRSIPVAVDNTFMSPYLQRPIELGADYVVHSTTKYLNGHSDSIGGVVVSSNDKDAEWLDFVSKSAGAILSPFDSFLTLRGIKTLAVRMDRHESNARRLVELLESHPAVGTILYPGLPSAPGYELQKRQADGFGAMVAFEVADLQAVRTVMESVQVFSFAESLGGVESLISHPASMTHAAVPKEELEALGISDGLVRISVGIEDANDLEEDLRQALDTIDA